MTTSYIRTTIITDKSLAVCHNTDYLSAFELSMMQRYKTEERCFLLIYLISLVLNTHADFKDIQEQKL